MWVIQAKIGTATAAIDAKSSRKDSKEEKMTAIDFTAEVEKRKENLLKDLFSLFEINSERDDSKVDAQHPFDLGQKKP